MHVYLDAMPGRIERIARRTHYQRARVWLSFPVVLESELMSRTDGLKMGSALLPVGLLGSRRGGEGS
jgi:hypothetical protein